MGPSSPSPKGAHPQLSAHIFCGQMAEWTKTPLGREVGLGPGHIVLDWDPAPPFKKRDTAPNFSLCLSWPNSSMDQAATWCRGRPRPSPHCARWGPSSLSPKGVTANRHGPKIGGAVPLHFSAHVYCDQTAGWIKMPLGTKV